MLNIQRLVYGDRNLVLSSVEISNNNIVNPVDVAKFLITLNKMNYSIKNIDPLFSLSIEGFSKFKDELFSIFDSMKIDGFIFRKTFADTQKLTNYTNKEWLVMFAQYSLTYNWSSEYSSIDKENKGSIFLIE